MALALWAGLVRVQHRGGARGACVVAAPNRRALAGWAAGRTAAHASGDGGAGVHVAWYGMLVCMMCHAQAPGPMAPFLAYGACGGCQIPSPALRFWAVDENEIDVTPPLLIRRLRGIGSHRAICVTGNVPR